MSAWGRISAPNFRHRINKIRTQIEDIRNDAKDAADPQLTIMQQNLANLLLQEDSYWRQRSKVFWLSDGDTNSKFFHASASARRRKNSIKKLRDETGNWVSSHDDLCAVVRNYFTSIFTARHGDYGDIISCVQSKVSDDDNNSLTQPFTEKEFQEAIFSMHPDKSPGPDGLNPAFYHRFWKEIGGDIFSAATAWLASDTFPAELNATHIVLAPKGDTSETMKDLRPISLYPMGLLDDDVHLYC